jgi:predicted permease
MSWIDGLRHRVRTVLRPGAYAQELADEFSHHRELHGAGGGSPFGNATYHREETRRMTWLAWTDLLRQDVGYAWRSIRRTPAVTAMVVITLALGVGVNGAVFNVLDQLYLRDPAGVVNAGGVRRIWTKHTRTGGGPIFYSRAMAYPQYKVAAEQWGDTAALAVMTLRGDFKLGGTRAGVSTNVLFASANYFTLLGIRPFKGRFFTAAEAATGVVTNQIVLSHRYWQTALAGDEAIIGKRIKLDTSEWEVIGIAQPGFDGIDLRAEQAWAPLGSLPGAVSARYETGSIWTSPRYLSFFTFGRLPTGTSAVDFERRSTAAMRDANRQFYGAFADTLSTLSLGGIIESRGPATPRQEELIITRLQVVALIVLIIAVANVVNLLLARAVSRRREIAVRLALGISRARLVRLITIESVVLAMLAAVAALFTAWWGGSVLRTQLMSDITFVQPAIHAHVVWVTLGVALACGVLAGVIPALQFSKPELTADLKEGTRAGGRRRSRLRDGLLVAQAALSVTLLVGATLLVRTLRNIQSIDIGFDTSHVFYASAGYDPGTAPPMAERIARIQEVEQRMAGRNGVAAVGRTALFPMGGFSFWSFWWGSDSSQSLQKTPPVGFAVGAKFFEASGMRVLAGRTFDDGPAAEGQLVVNDALAKLLWPGQDAIGQCVRFDKSTEPCTIVTGVVSTASRGELIEQPQPQYYLPIGVKRTENMGGTILVVRTAPGANLAAVEADAMALIKQALPNSYPQVRAMEEIVAPKYRPWRLGARLFAGVGLLALIVAVVGIYSTVAYSVGQRTHEFGVRIALGAQLRDIVNQVVGEGVRVVAVGIGIGVALAFAAGRLVKSLLYGVEPTDLSAMILAAVVLLGAAVAASVLPAWRAGRADPVGALRRE